MYNTHDGPVEGARAAGGKCGWTTRMRCPAGASRRWGIGESIWGVPALARECGEAGAEADSCRWPSGVEGKAEGMAEALSMWESVLCAVCGIW